MDLSRRTLTVVTVVLVLALAAGSVVSARPPLDEPPPDPEPLAPTGVAWLDNIYYGAMPPDGMEHPVLVFVHGLAGAAEDWWGPTAFDGTNDMYVAAYQAGYRTAFVSLSTEGRPRRSMWHNGLVLRLQLEAIARYYGVEQLEIVAHSKGGVDAQTAIVWFGGWERVAHLFTLGTPHQGSELADVAYSWWGWWLAESLGFHDAGTYTLQTGYMRFFRELTDPRAREQPVSYHSGAGTDMGPEGSMLQLMGWYLSLFGDNDGVVTVASTELAGADTLFLEPFHHMNIYMGRTAFPWIDALLRSTVGVQARLGAPATGRRMLPFLLESNSILRGGRLTGSTIEALPIEPSARTARFVLLASDEGVTSTLTGPDGLGCPLELVSEDASDILGDAVVWVHATDEPMAGEWTMYLDGPPDAAYLLIVIIESPLRVTLRGLPKGTLSSGRALELSAEANAPVVHQIETRITRSLPRRGGNRVEVKSDLGPTLAWLPSKEGTYVVSASVTGQTARGMPFERSFVRSLAVVKPETLSHSPTLLDR